MLITCSSVFPFRKLYKLCYFVANFVSDFKFCLLFSLCARCSFDRDCCTSQFELRAQNLQQLHWSQSEFHHMRWCSSRQVCWPPYWRYARRTEWHPGNCHHRLDIHSGVHNLGGHALVGACTSNGSRTRWDNVLSLILIRHEWVCWPLSCSGLEELSEGTLCNLHSDGVAVEAAPWCGLARSESNLSCDRYAVVKLACYA